ncbi:hypothetical protein ACHAXR_004399, partial [Thalassiosira sp. AJA248-18]
MAHSPKGVSAAYALKKVFSASSHYENQNDWNEHEDEGLVLSDRVSSRVVQSHADGSAEAILSSSDEEVPLSRRTKSNIVPSTTTSLRNNNNNNNIALSNNNNSHSPLPMTRTKSTPHNGHKVTYAMRKVFSREEKSEWHNRQGEAEELMMIHHDDNNAMSLSSRVSSRVAAVEDDGGAELVLEEGSTSVGLYANNSNEASLFEHEGGSSATTKITATGMKLNKGSGYRLRRFLSTPASSSSSGQKKASGIGIGGSALQRTTSYDKEEYYNDEDEGDYTNDGGGGGGYQHERRVSPLYNNEHQQPSPHRLSSPVGLKRTLSLRRNKSGLSTTNIDKSKTASSSLQQDDDLSTVAESVDDSTSAAGQHTNSKKKKGKKLFMFKQRMMVVSLAFLLVAFAAVGVVYIIVGSSKDDDASSSSAMNNVEYTDLIMVGSSSNDVEVATTVVNDGRDANDGTTDNDSSTEEEEEEVEATDYNIGTLEEKEGYDEEEIPLSSEDGSDNAVIDDEAVPLEQEQKPQQVQPKEEPSDIPEDPTPESSSTTPAVVPSSAAAIVLATTPSPTTESPTKKPSKTPSKNPTYAPTIDTYTKFYLMADCPYDDNERNNLMPSFIKNLSRNADFLVHLGDLQYAKVDDCKEYAYREARDIIKKSPIPTFVLPGDNDINDCDDIEHGEEMWTEYFHKIDEQYWGDDVLYTSLENFVRWGDLDESFSFLYKGVLYFGLNIVGGRPYSNSEKRRRHKEHLSHIREILGKLDEDDFQVLVLFGHAEPSDHHDDFFKGDDGFAAIVEELGKPTIHFHGDYHEYYEVEGEVGDFDDLDNYVRISLDGESTAPPIKVEIDVSRENPIR